MGVSLGMTSCGWIPRVLVYLPLFYSPHRQTMPIHVVWMTPVLFIPIYSLLDLKLSYMLGSSYPVACLLPICIFVSPHSRPPSLVNCLQYYNNVPAGVCFSFGYRLSNNHSGCTLMGHFLNYGLNLSPTWDSVYTNKSAYPGGIIDLAISCICRFVIFWAASRFLNLFFWI